MSEKILKESFISNLNGTSLTEVSVGLTIPPLCILFRGLAFVLHHKKYGEPFYSWTTHLLLDVMLLILPQIICCTVLSDFLYYAQAVIIATCMILCYIIYSGKTTYMNLPLKNICKSFLALEVKNETVPAISTLRSLMNVFTVICILAVDFPIFPRRYAKTETYGTGVMDIGVGIYIFANALVSPEAKGRGGMFHSKRSMVVKQVFSVWPLILLGFGRLISVKAVAYHEHVSEYGVHWNFFFTLAIVRVSASLLLTVFATTKAWIVATAFVSCYQVVLETTPLKSFILYGGDGKGTRIGFLNANREGVFSLFGYIGIYMTGVQVGVYVLKKRQLIKDWITVTWKLMYVGFMLFAILHVLGILIEPVSRRIANLTFCIWIIGLSLLLLSLILLFDVILVFAKSLFPGSKVPCTWIIEDSTGISKKKDLPLNRSKRDVVFCLIEAINRNQLLFFLISNVLTGLVNMLIDTIHSSTFFSLSVLLSYMFFNSLLMYILHINSISVKWW